MRWRFVVWMLACAGLSLFGGRPASAEPEPDADREDRLEQLEDRVNELEAAQDAKDSATRSVISQALSDLGANINNVTAFGGTLEVIGGWVEEFNRTDESVLRINTAQIDFEITPSPWLLGSLILEYNDGLDNTFTTTEENDVSIDRINIDTTFVRIGNTDLFFPYAKVGRVVLPFGISTGDPVADVLTIEDPLTVEVFETKRDAIQIGFEFPTPPVEPETPIPAPPLARPLVIAPLVEKLAGWLGYHPFPAPPPEQLYVAPPKRLPPFMLAFYTYSGKTYETSGASNKWNPSKHFGGTAGYRNRGACAVPFCIPWSFEVDVDYNNSVFESRFLSSEYLNFFEFIKFEPGMAVHTRSSLGPVAVVAEWNGALENTTFRDDANRVRSIRPRAWQVSLAYQFDWNRWVEKVGEQGTYVTAGYSRSYDLSGIQRDIAGNLVRVGWVPEERFLVGAGEWVLPNLRLSVEYARVKDYPRSQGGTGNSVDGFLSLLTFTW